MVALRFHHLAGPGLQVCSRLWCWGTRAPLCSPGPGTCAARPPVRQPIQAPKWPAQGRAARTSARVPGCLLANNTGELVEGSACGLVGWALGPSSKVPNPRLLSDVDLRIWSESSRGSKKVLTYDGSCTHRVRVHPLTEVHASCSSKPSTLVPRIRTTPTTTSFPVFLGLPELVALIPPPITLNHPPSHPPGVSRRHCHDFNLPLNWSSSALRQLDPHQLYK